MDLTHFHIRNTPESKLLIDIINNQKISQFNNINWDRFLNLVIFHELAPLAFYRLKNYTKNIPENVYSYLKSRYHFNIIRNLKYWGEFLELYTNCETKKNLLILPLKGMDLMIRFYPKLHLRSMVDMDILIKEGDFESTEKLLYESGYRKQNFGFKEKYWRQKQYHITFIKKNLIVEVHWELDFKRYGRTPLPGIWQRAKDVMIENRKIRIFSPEDAFFSFALHLRRFGNVLSLKQTLDVAEIMNNSPHFDWDYILHESRKNKMQVTVYFLLTQARLFTPAKFPSQILNKLKIPVQQKKSIEKFILINTFLSPFSYERIKENYTKAHFILYDNLWEPFWYVINIPYEQFTKFYNLTPYAIKADILYKLRLLYMPFKQILRFCRILRNITDFHKS